MKRITFLAVFVALALGGLMLPSLVSGQVYGPWGIYEDWSKELIRPDRWIGSNDPGLEVKREIKKIKVPETHGFVNGELVMRYRAAGSPSFPAGVVNGGAQRLTIKGVPAERITQMEADFRIKKYTLTGGCGTTRVRPAAITLSKFNDGTPGEGAIGDHFVRINAERRWNDTFPEGQFVVTAHIWRCGDVECIGGNMVAFNPLIGFVTAEEWFTLRVNWDPLNNRFLVGLNNGTDKALYYGASDTLPAKEPRADIRMQVNAQNCLNGPTEADTEIQVGEVRTNESAVIP